MELSIYIRNIIFFIGWYLHYVCITFTLKNQRRLTEREEFLQQMQEKQGI